MNEVCTKGKDALVERIPRSNTACKLPELIPERNKERVEVPRLVRTGDNTEAKDVVEKKPRRVSIADAFSLPSMD
jgi:hypothetical protein